MKYLLLALIMILPGCSVAEEALTVDFTILGALIAPTKVNGKTWDASSGIDKTSSGMIAEMVMPGSGFAASAVISEVSKVAAQGIAAPDIIGYITQTGPTTRSLANIAGTRMALATKQFNFSRDSYTPTFQTGYSGWPVFKDTRFQIKLWDADIRNDDPVGTVELTQSDIQEAIMNGKPTWINVSDQSMNQVLFIQITASKSLPNTLPKMNGNRWK